MLRNINRLIFPVLTALAAVPVGAYAGGPVAPANAQLAAAIAAVGHQLNDAQMDTVTAGQVLGIECAGCTLASSTSMSANGITTSMSSTGAPPGGGGSSGGGGPNIPNLSTSTPQLSAKIIAIITAASTPAIINP